LNEFGSGGLFIFYLNSTEETRSSETSEQTHYNTIQYMVQNTEHSVQAVKT